MCMSFGNGCKGTCFFISFIILLLGAGDNGNEERGFWIATYSRMNLIEITGVYFFVYERSVLIKKALRFFHGSDI